MLVDSLIVHVTRLVPRSALLIGVGLGVLLLVWRLWRFTIVQMLWSNEPKVLPYWMPVIGHTWSFMRNPEKLINNGYEYFGNSQPFALTVAGRRTVVIRDVQDVAAVWRNTTALSFDPFVAAVLKAFGIAPASVRKVFSDPKALIHGDARSQSLLISDNPSNKCYMNLERDWFKVQLLAPERLQQLQDKYYHFLGESLEWEELSPTYVVSSSKSWTDSKTISLKGFSRHTVSHCSTSTFFGTKLLQVAPSFGQDYQDFEEESWKIFYRLPPFLVKKSHRAKAKAIDGLVRYLSLPEEEQSELAWIFRTMNIELRYLALPPRDVAGITMIIIWAINNNAHKIAFWIFAHLLHDPVFFAALRAETDAAFSPSGAVDMDVLLNACPHLDAIWHETLRFYNAASAVREALAPCVVGTKSIHKGDTVLAPFRQFHLHGSIFGADAAIFSPRRFLENKALPRTKGYAPFGGGHTYCPGRLFAQREIYLFVAVTLWRFELNLAPQEGEQKVPEVDVNTPSAAAMGPAEDVLVQIHPRLHKR